MSKRRTGLLLVAAGLLIFTGVLPFLPAAGAVTSGAHLLMGFALGIGVVLMFAAALADRRGPRRPRAD